MNIHSSLKIQERVVLKYCNGSIFFRDQWQDSNITNQKVDTKFKRSFKAKLM